MSDMFLALQEQKITALREQLALKYTQISGLWAENAELRARVAELERQPMSDEDIDDIHDVAAKSFRRYQGHVLGQQLRPEDVFEWHLVRAVEAFHGIGAKK